VPRPALSLLPPYATTAIGSLPHTQGELGLQLALQLDVPFLPEFPALNPGEFMMASALEAAGRRTGLLIGEINDAPAREHFLARFLEEAGFVNTTLGFQMRRVTAIALAGDGEGSEEEELGGERSETA